MAAAVGADRVLRRRGGMLPRGLRRPRQHPRQQLLPDLALMIACSGWVLLAAGADTLPRRRQGILPRGIYLRPRSPLFSVLSLIAVAPPDLFVVLQRQQGPVSNRRCRHSGDF